MEKKKYFVNNVMFIFGLSYFVVLVAVAIALFTISRPGSAAIFLALALSFGFIGFRYGSTVEFGDDGVTLKFLGIIACLDPIGQPRGRLDYSLAPEEYRAMHGQGRK